MFFFAALMIGAFILSFFLTPKAKVENARASSLSDFQFPRAKEGDPVTRIYGTVKTRGANSIYVGDFKAEPIKKKVKTGLFSSKKQIIGYKYKVGLDLAVALGPCVTFRRMWFGKNEVWNGCIAACEGPTQVTIDLPELYGGQDRQGGVGGTFTMYCGNFDQPQDDYLISKLGAGVPAYVGVAHVVFNQFWFGNTTSIEAISFEASHFSNSMGVIDCSHIMPNQLDANPIEVLYDLYVNDWGNLGMDDGIIDLANWQEAAAIIWNEGNGVSVEIGNSQEGKDITREILRQINAMIYQDPSSGYIRIKLIRNDYAIEELPILGPSEIKVVRNYTKKLWQDTINRVRVKYQDRARNWKDDAVATADDFANIRYQNRIRAVDIGMPCLKDGDLANQIAARELANLNVPLFQAEIESNRTAVPLGPGQPFILNWPEYDIEAMVVRIRKFGQGTKDDGKVTMFVMQDEFAIDATVYSSPAGGTTTPDDLVPGDIEEFKYYEIPWFLNNAAGFEIVLGHTRYGTFAVQPTTASLDYFVMVDDPTEDVEALSNAPYSNSAQLNEPLARFDGFVDGVVTALTVKLVSDITVLTNSSEAGVKAGANLFYLGEELLSYETFTDNLDDTYTLNNVHRSMLDTGWFAHAEDAVLYFFDGQEGFLDDESEIVPFDAYMLDRSVYGRSLEENAVITPLTPVGRMFLPAPPDMVTIETERALDTTADEGSTVTVDWRERSRVTTTIALEDDATDPPEASTTYKVELIQGVTVLSTDSGIAAATFELDLTPAAVGAAEIRVTAELDGKESFSFAPYPFSIISADSLLIDGSLVTVDGDSIEF